MFMLECSFPLIIPWHSSIRNARYSTTTTAVSHLYGSRNSVINEYSYVDCVSSVVDQGGTEVNPNNGMSYLYYHIKCQAFQCLEHECGCIYLRYT